MSIISFPPKVPLPSDKIWKIIKKVGRAIAIALFGDNEEIGNRKAAELGNSEVNEIAELNSVLLEYQHSVKEISNSLEREIINECTEFLDKTLLIFQRANSNLDVYSIESVKKRFDRILRSMNGTFMKHMAKRISLDDSQCVAILKMVPGELKGQRMKEHRTKVFQESIDEIIEKMTGFIDGFFEMIEFSFDNRLNDLSFKIEEKANAFSKLSAITDKRNESVEKMQLQVNYIISAIDAVNLLK